jgi:hypothetical protein
MYLSILIAHSWVRWAVVFLGLWVLLRAYAGVGSRRAWTPTDDAAGRWFSVSLDIEFLLGLALYAWLSPITTQAFSDLGGAMQDATLRFWAVVHPLLMVVAIALAHIGRARVRLAMSDAARHRTSAIFNTPAFIAMLVGIPWPFTAVFRPLLPM